MGPLKNLNSPPRTGGKAETTGGSRLLDLGIINSEMSLATTTVASRRRPTLRNLLESPMISMVNGGCGGRRGKGEIEVSIN